jgi:hypothetical protein
MMGRLGLPELVIIFCIAILVFGPRGIRWLQSDAAAKTFNGNFFLSLTVILALFALAELWFFYE